MRRCFVGSSYWVQIGGRALFPSPTRADFLPCESHTPVSTFLADRTIKAFFEQVRKLKSTVSNVPWPLVCTNGSTFRRRSWNDADTPSDCAQTAWNTAVKWNTFCGNKKKIIELPTDITLYLSYVDYTAISRYQVLCGT